MQYSCVCYPLKPLQYIMAHQQSAAVEGIKGAHEVITACHLLRRHKEYFYAWRRLLQLLHGAARLVVFLSPTQVATGDACLLQVEHLQRHKVKVDQADVSASCSCTLQTTLVMSSECDQREAPGPG